MKIVRWKYVVYYVMRKKNEVLCAEAGSLIWLTNAVSRQTSQTLSEFENFLLYERILINVTTCQNKTSC
jgi:hypothetical protein